METFTGGFNMPGNRSGYYAKIFLSDISTKLNPISNVEEITQ